MTASNNFNGISSGPSNTLSFPGSSFRSNPSFDTALAQAAAQNDALLAAFQLYDANGRLDNARTSAALKEALAIQVLVTNGDCRDFNADPGFYVGLRTINWITTLAQRKALLSSYQV